MSIFEVIKYNGNPDVFAWKYPKTSFNTGSQLIVNESQEAVFVKGGIIYDIFTSGTYTLNTNNIPLLSTFLNIPFGGNSPFSAEIWFINKAISLDIKWGTATPIQLQDPKYNVFIPVRSYGQFGIKISNSALFITKLVGTMKVFDQSNISKYFKGLYLTSVKDLISSYLIHKHISIMEINAYIEELSNYLHNKMTPLLEEYGIQLINFYVYDISVPENDRTVIKLKDALAKKAEMDIIGYNYQQKRSFDTLEGAAKNPGSNLMQTGLDIGMSMALATATTKQFEKMTDQLQIEDEKECPNCGSKMLKKKRYCSDCGCDTLSNNETIICSKCGNEYSKTMKFCPECGDKYIPCPKCGYDLDENMDECPNCKTKLNKKCSNCNTIIEEGMRFCPECGTSLLKTCPTCGTEIIDGFKFCAQCGTKL